MSRLRSVTARFGSRTDDSFLQQARMNDPLAPTLLKDAIAPLNGPRPSAAVQRRDPGLAPPRPLPEGLSRSYGIAILDRDYRIVWCNDSAAAHFGIDVQQDIGQPVATVVRHASFAAYVAAGNFSKSLRMHTAESDGPILSLQFVPYVASGWLLLSRNIARAARLEAVRRECIANVSHELRTPLTVLVGFLETVRDLKLDPRLSRDCLDRMEEQCKRMQRIIEDLLQLSKLEAAPEPPADERVDVRVLLARIRTEAEMLSAGRHRIVLDAEDGFDLLAAENEIASAFGNLASNAVRYTEPGGTVRLAWRASSNGAEFAVEDTGVGIAKEHIPRLTQRFYRVDRDHSRHSGGTGLGLAIVKDVLARHQATLEIESEPGKGSRFRAKFPAHRVVAAGARFATAEGGSRADAVGIAPGVRNDESEIEMSPRPLGKIPFRDAADKIPIQALPLIVRQPTKEVAYEDQDRHSSHQSTWADA